ncbi:protein eyes shut isoform X2 [Cimex lectularius]|uniref:Protein eyes shut n=1 Tax=Cimex lectularius TaxID=79782 RepID=A0A8I6STK7_CIMLE|nr:protein eyes shut isoform X2 [Cimex lectularius]XP_024082773.1 protein eyes shut isoform X2 [Cimex lectularius]
MMFTYLWVAFFTSLTVRCSASLACITNPCVYGICMDAVNGSYTCYCIDGYTGINCQTNWDECWSSPCQNGGTCHDGIAFFNCSCPDGFVGETCDENINECGSNPCLNNGTCLDVANGYNCQCQPGYSGYNCEMDMAVCNTTDETRCANGGACIEGPGITFSCRCLPGWTSRLCDLPVDECSSSPCENGGVCIDMHAMYVCACPYGYTGSNCETQVELCTTNTCENDALCVVEGRTSVCYCVPDFHGDRCQFKYDECQKGPGCLNGGSCIDGVDSYTCSCTENFTGRFCECQYNEAGKLNCNYFYTVVPSTTESVQNGIKTSYVTSFPNFYSTNSSIGIESTLRTELTSYVPIDFSSPGQTDETDKNYITTETTTVTGKETSYTQDFSKFSSGFTNSPFEISTSSGVSLTDYYQNGSQTITTIPNITNIPTMPNIPTLSNDKFSVTFDHQVPTFTESTLTTDKTITPMKSGSSRDSKITTLKSTDTTIIESGITFFTTIHDFLTTSVSSKSDETEFPELQWTTQSSFSTDYYTSKEISFPIETGYSYEPTYTTESMNDCSKFVCQNGGTCTNYTQGSKCHCAFGWKGKFCDEAEGIKVAAFKGRSYLLHSFGNYTHTRISFKIRTLANDGIIMYAHMSSSVYMTLYLQGGYLRFQFSCGIQTMLFSELKYSINTGFEIELALLLHLYEKGGIYNHCNGTVLLNGTLSMSGKQEVSFPKYLHMLSGVLYFGGIPSLIIHQVDLPIKQGITACMHSLSVNDISRDLYSQALDGLEVSECESLACLSNPCQNSATCIEIGQKWNCLCPSGYFGNMCEKSVCLNNPCKYGGSCIPYPGSGFICLCPLGKHGMFCDQDLEIGHPYFSSSISGLSSYTAYPLPGPIHHSFELHFRFIPSSLEQISLMVFIGQGHPHDSSSDHLAVSLIKGYVVLTWNLGSGPRRIFTPQAVLDSNQRKQIHTVKLGRSGQIGWLQVDNMPNVTGTSPGWLSQLNTKPVIYIGGHESQNFSGLPHDLPLHTGFSGCLFDVELRAGKVRLMIQRTRDAVGRNVGQCSTKHCNNSTCLHHGACMDHGATYTCLCQEGWFGAGCAIRYNPCDSSRHNCSEGSTCVPLSMGYECDCPLGRSGKFCQNDESLSDVGFSGHRSYLSIAPASLDLIETCIDIEIRPIASHGIILFSSQSQGPSTSFISLSLHGGVLELRLQPIGGQRRNGEILIVRSGQVIALGQWTRVRAGRYGRRIFLWVEGSVNAGTLLPGEILLPSHSPLYIGGVPDLSKLPSGAMAGLPVSLSGCVRKLWINWRSVTLDNHHIITARNIKDCDGTACGGDVCMNGGSCWLTPDNKPMCTCLQQYNGFRCENQVSCAEVGCENRGRCEKQGKKSQCHCPPGWSGPFCNIGVDYTAPHFSGNSYLIVDSIHGLSKREGEMGSPFDKRVDQNITYIYVNFSSAQYDGMLLWTTKGSNYLGLGLERGLIKVVWGKSHIDRNEVLLPGSIMADGAWHNLIIRCNEKDLNFWVDRTIIHSYKSNMTILTDGIFYLGGFPGERKVIEETNGSFNIRFSGCIKELAWNDNFSIVDFSKYEGENLRSCDMMYLFP